MRQHAVSCTCLLVMVAIAFDVARPTEAHTPIAGVRTSTDAALIRPIGTGIDMVRMPPPPAQSQGPTPAVSLDPPRPSPRPIEPDKPSGRLLSLPVVVGRPPSDSHKAWLGVVADTLERPLAGALGTPRSQGVLILETKPGAPAGRSGLQFGDIIVAFNGEPIGQMQGLCQRMASATPGREVALEVWRVAGGDLLQTLHRLADIGNAHVLHRLGKMYAGGFGVARDETKAAEWYRKGAAAGNVPAMTELAGALLEGRGVERNAREAAGLLRAASDNDDPEAMHRLGVLLRDGKDADKNVAEAMQLLAKAGNAGHPAAMVEIGQTYDRGLGVGVDAAKALAWYKRGADLGDPAAVMNLGNLHLQGRGVPQNAAAAVGMFRKAADLGNTFAMHNLAWTLDQGMGVRRDPEQAADLVLRALALRNPFSYEQMTKNAHNWTPDLRRALQRKLRAAGVFTGPADGAFGASTIAAIDAHVARSPPEAPRPCSGGGNVL